MNVDLAPELAMRHEITGVPTLVIFKNDLILDTIIGMPSPRVLKTRLEEIAALAAPAGAKST